MFFKKDNRLEAAQDEATQIVASIDKLNQLINSIKVTNFDYELRLIHKDGENKILDVILAIKPIIKPNVGQPSLGQQITTMRKTIYNEFLTIKRNLLLNKISELHLDLYMICISAQELIIQNQNLIDNELDPAIKKKINSADKLFETLLDTLSVYNLISNSFLKSTTSLLNLLQPTNSAPLSSSLGLEHRQQREAIYAQDAHFKQFDHFIDSFSERTLFSSLKQLIESLSEETDKTHWKRSLRKFWPVIRELEDAHSDLFTQCSSICSRLKDAKKDDDQNDSLKTEPKL